MKKIRQNLVLMVVLGALIIALAVLTSTLFHLTTSEMLVMGWLLTALYAVIIMILLVNMAALSKKTEIRQMIKEVEKPVYINNPIMKEVVKEVEKPVYIDRPVVKEASVKKPRKILDIPKYNYVASTETKTYHKRDCRFGKLIKKKFKVTNNSQAFFKANGYKPCKICIKKKK